MKRYTPEKRLKKIIQQAFEDVAKPADFKPPDRELCIWIRSNLVMMYDYDIHRLLPYVMVDLIDNLSEPESDSVDLDIMIDFMSVSQDLRALRSSAKKAFALIDQKQASAIVEWLQWIRESKGPDGDVESIDLTLSYWTERAATSFPI